MKGNAFSSVHISGQKQPKTFLKLSRSLEGAFGWEIAL